MWGGFFLLCSLAALVAFRISRRLSRPFRWLSLSFGILASSLAVPVGFLAAYGAMMYSSETAGNGLIAGRNLVWSIERQGCGATTAGLYTVRLGPHAWWSYPILTADAFPIPRSVEAAGKDAVRIIVDLDSAGEGVPAEGLIVPIAASGRPDRVMSFDRGVRR